MSRMSATARERPIGVFDSGVGGLTVLHELLVALPHEDFVYLGDTARFPYGEQTHERAARVRAGDRRAPARAGREAARRRLQLGDRGGAAAAAASGSRGSSASTCSAWSSRPPCRRSRRRAAAASACWPRRRPSRAARTSAAIAAGDPLVHVESVACPDLAPIIQSGFPFDERVVETVRRYMRAAARGGRRHGDPRLHALPAGAPDAAADARPRRARSSARARASRARSSTCWARAGCEPRATARATTASSAPATSRRSATLGTRFLQMPLGEVERVDADPGGGAGVTSGATSVERSYGRAPDELRPVEIEPGFVRTRDRLGADLGRRDARDLHRLGRGERAALDGRPRHAAG